MKANTLIFLGLLALVLGISTGCGKKNEDKNEIANNYANVALTCGNGGQNRQSSLWTGASQHGFYPYGNYAGYANGYGPSRRHSRYSDVRNSSWGYSQNQSFCGCPAGYMPACDGSYGMTCVSQNQYRNQQYPIYNYNSNDQNFRYHGYGQMRPVSNQSNNSCYSQVTVTCRIDDQYSCSHSGGHCQASRPNSPYGICVY